jgi:4-diphosphocytidyl-2-C-methyl-D-erythritol kinase
VFGAFSSESKADEVLAHVPAAWRAWKAHALAHHPLKSLLHDRAVVE